MILFRTNPSHAKTPRAFSLFRNKPVRLLALPFLTPVLMAGLLRQNASAADLAACFPSSTLCYVETAGIQKWRTLKDHPVTSVFNSKSAGRIFEAFFPVPESSGLPDFEKFGKMLTEQTGLPPEQVSGLFNGPAAIALFDVPWEGKSSRSRLGLVAAYSGTEAQIHQIIAAMERLDEDETPLSDEFDSRTEAHEGVTIQILEKKPDDEADRKKANAEDADDNDEEEDEANEADEKKDGNDAGAVKTALGPDGKPETFFGSRYAWAVTDGKLIVGNRIEAVHDIISCVQGKAGTDLADSKSFQSARASAGESDLVAVLPLQEVWPKLLESFKADATAKPVPFAPASVISGLGLDKIDSVVLRAHAAPVAMELDVIANFTSRPAVLDVYATDGPGVIPWQIPRTATDSSHGTFIPAEAYKKALLLLQNIFPAGAKTWGTAIKVAETRLGVRSLEDLMGALGPRWFDAAIGRDLADDEDPGKVYYDKMNFPLAGPRDCYVMGVEVRDSKLLSQALAALTSGMPAAVVARREYQGQTISTFTPKMSGIGIAWVLTPDWLFFSLGQEDLLEGILGRLAAGDKNGGFWDRPEVHQALSLLPAEDATSTEISELGAHLEHLARILAEENGEDGQAAAAFRDARFPIISSARYHLGPTSLRATTRTLPVKPPEK